MSTVVDFPPRDNCDRHFSRHRLWDRLERADLLEQYLDWQAQGVSQRQAAKQLQVPRSTLQAWHSWPAPLDSCPEGAQFCHSGPGLAFLHRLVLALPLVCGEVGAGGMRLVCLLLNLTGLARCIAASYGAQQPVTGQVAHAIVDYRPAATARLATEMPRKTITGTQAATCTGSLCLVATEPVSHVILLAHRAQARAQGVGNALMTPAWQPLPCEGRQAPSDEAPGLVASVEPQLGAPHSPALFHGPPELSTAVGAPLAAKERAAHRAVTEAKAQLEPGQAHLESASEQPQKRRAGRPPQAPMGLEQAHLALKAASHEHERLAQPRQQVRPSSHASGPAYHFVDLERGGRRNGPLLAAAIRAQRATMRAVAQHEQLSQRCLARLETAERVVPNMQATIAFVAGYGRQQVAQLALTPPASCAMHARLIPSYALARVAQTLSLSDGQPLRQLAKGLRTSLVAPGGALSPLPPETQSDLRQQAKECAEVLQRSRATVAGRNGSLSLRNHQLRGLDRPRQRACLTAMHHFFLTRSDGTTAAARFFGQKPRSMFAAILDSVDLLPAPRSPQRRF